MPQINANLTLNTAQAQATFNQFVRSINSNRLGQPLGRISGDAAEFNKSMQAATARVTAFGLSAGAILQVKNAIVAAASATIEVDKQLIELNTFLGQSTSELDKFSKSLFQIAKNTAAPFSDAAGAAKEFARQGLSANEVLERTGAALTLARISGLGYQDSVQGITTAINSFGKEALKATEITNKLIAVDTRFAVSSADLNEAIRRVGSSAEESGVGIDSLIAAVTAAQQTTGRGGAVIGNALKTIFTRLQRPEVLTQLEQLGVAVRDQNGFLLDGIGILKNYSDATKNLSQSEKSRTAELIGGIYQINQLNALIKDLSNSNSVYANSLSISNSATDEAKKKNEELNKSLSSMLQGIKNTATEAASSLGSSFLRPIVEIGTSVSENLLKLVNPSGVGSELGAQIIKGLAGALGEGLSKTALPLLGSLAGLLAVKMGGFGKTAFKELAKSSGNVFESKKELQIQERINDVVSRNPGLISQINAGKITQKQAEAQILDLILKQNQELRAQAALAQRTFTTVTQAAPRKKRFGMFADGYLPSAGAVEENTARGFGAKNPKAKIIQATIKGKTGPVMVNSEEDVIPNFAGTGETAIIPRYRNVKDIPRMAKGYVPNFAKGININDKIQDYTGEILKKDKVIETRDSVKGLKPYVGKQVGLVRTGVGDATLVGYAKIGNPIEYKTAEQFRADYPKHKVKEGSKHDFANSKYGVKYGFPLSEVTPTKNIKITSRGNYVAREIPNFASGYIPNFAQEISSAGTSQNQVPGLFAKFGAELGPRNIDIGGGKYNKGTNFLKKKFGIFSRVHDKYNRSTKFNDETLKELYGSADTATVANVLNVIKEKSAREELLEFVSKSIKPAGSAYFSIYEKDKTGIGAITPRGYQNNLPTDAFLEEISKYFNITKKTGNYIVGSPISKASGYIPNFAFSSMKSPASGDRKFVDPETYSYLRYKLSDDKKAIDLKFSKSELKGQGSQMFERLGVTARRMDLPVRSSNLSSQANDVLDITDASLARSGKYAVEEVLKVAFPQLIHRQKGSSKNTSLSVNVDDGLNHSNNELSSKNIFSTVSGFASEKYKGNAKLLRNSIIDGSFDISNVETNFAGGRVPNFAERRDVIQRIGKKKIFARFEKHFEAGKDYQGFYNIHGEEFNNRKLTAQEAKIYANITSAISPSVPDYVAAQFAAPIFNRFMQTRSTNVEDYFNLAPSKIVSRHKTVASLGLFGRKGEMSKKGNIRTRDDARRYGLSKALRGVDLGSDDTAKTRHYARAILQDKTAFPIDTNVIQAILGGKKPSKTEAAKLVSLANEFATLNKIESGAAGLQAAIFKSNSKHTEKYSPDTVKSALSGIQGRFGGYVPNFANPRIVGQGSNLFVSSLYDTLSGEHGGGPEYPFARPGMGAAFLNKEKTNDMIKLIKPFVESGSRVVFGAQAGRMNGDLGLIQGLAGNKMVVEALKASYPKLASKFVQEGTSTANLTSLFDKFYKTLGPDKMREIVSPFIEPDILKFYQKNKNFGSSISRLAEFGSESLTQASSSEHSIYPAAIRGKGLSRIEPVNAQKLFQMAGGLSDEETKKLFGTVRIAKLPIGFRFEKGDAASKILGLSQGYVPNFAGLGSSLLRSVRSTLERLKSGNVTVADSKQLEKMFGKRSGRVIALYDNQLDKIILNKTRGTKSEFDTARVMAHEGTHRVFNRLDAENNKKLSSEEKFLIATGQAENAGLRPAVRKRLADASTAFVDTASADVKNYFPSYQRVAFFPKLYDKSKYLEEMLADGSLDTEKGRQMLSGPLGLSVEKLAQVNRLHQRLFRASVLGVSKKKSLRNLSYREPEVYDPAADTNVPLLSSGYIPNFASTFNAEKIKQMGGYVGQANKASAPGLYNILNRIGIPIELDSITKKGLTDVLSSKENKLKLYNFLKREPIEIANYPDSYSEIKDGNHRFTLAQFAGIKNIPAKYKDNFSGGYIPNFSGLSDAVSREKTMSGLPASQIMAHFDGGGNPIAVTNKRDEPNGLKDVPNFAIPRNLLRFLSTRNRGLTNPVSGGSELFAGNLVTALLNVLAENEKVSPDLAASASAGIPATIGIVNVFRALTSKRGTTGQKLAAGLTGAGQIGFGALTGYSAKADLEKRINEKRYSEALDRSKTAFQNLTENTAELADTFAKLEAAYRDPQADPRTITKLAKKQQELLNKVSLKNPDLGVKLASEPDLGKKQTIIEDSAREAQRQESIRQASLKFSVQGKISGKDASAKISDFFSEIINSGNAEVLNQDLSQAKPKDFGDILKKGGLNIAEFSEIFQTDELKQAFIDGLKATQKLNEISQQQASEIRELSKPLTDKKQKIDDAREVRLAISGVLKEQLPELASFASGFSKRAGISASSNAALAVTRSETSVAFNNTLQAQLADPKFSAGLPANVKNRLLGIESPSKETAKELESLKTLPGLSKEQIVGLDKLIDFNNQQNRKLENANKIASETKNIQLKFLALQEKLAFGGDIRSSIDPEARREAMGSAIRGPLTYQLGGLLGSKRTQVAGATDFLTDTIKKYPGLLQTKDGKEPADVQGVKRELAGLNAMDMQRDLLKRAGMAEMMGLGQTGSILRSKAFDQNYLLESAGLKTNALFGSPEVPEEVKKAMEEYEKFNVKGVREFKGEEQQLKRLEDLLAPIKQKITESLQTEGKTLAEAFIASLNKTFGEKGIITNLVNLTTNAIVDKDATNKDVENLARASAGQGGLMPTGIGSNANGLTKYSSSIADAVKREKTALASRGIMGVPNFAMAGINLERSVDLMTPSNPAGFAITNSIDEKNGLRSLGMRSSGFVPNFAIKDVRKVAEGIKDSTKGYEELVEKDNALKGIAAAVKGIASLGAPILESFKDAKKKAPGLAGLDSLIDSANLFSEENYLGASAKVAEGAASLGSIFEKTSSGFQMGLKATASANVASLGQYGGKFPGAASAAGLIAEIATSKNNAIAEDTSDIIFGKKTDGKRNALGTGLNVASLGLTAASGPFGLGVTTATLGYRTGNVIENKLGIGDKLGEAYAGGAASAIARNADKATIGLSSKEASASGLVGMRKAQLMQQADMLNKDAGYPEVNRFAILAKTKNAEDRRRESQNLIAGSAGAFIPNFAKKTVPYDFGKSTPPKPGVYSAGIKEETIPPQKPGLFSVGPRQLTTEEILARTIKEGKESKAAKLAQRRATRATRPAGPNTITEPNDFGKSTPPKPGVYSAGIKEQTIPPQKPGLFSAGPRELTKEEILARTIKEGKESKAATLAQRQGLIELERSTRPAGPNPIFARTVKESKRDQIGAARYAQRQAELSKLASPIFDIALDPVKIETMSAEDLQNRLKISKQPVNTAQSALSKILAGIGRNSSVAEKLQTMGPGIVNDNLNTLIKKTGDQVSGASEIRGMGPNARTAILGSSQFEKATKEYFEKTAAKRAEMKMFAEADAARNAAGSGFRNKGMFASMFAERARLEDLYGPNYGPNYGPKASAYSYMPKAPAMTSAMESNYKELSKEEVDKILEVKGSGTPKKPSGYLSNGGYGPTATPKTPTFRGKPASGGVPPSSNIISPESSGLLNKLKGAGKSGLKGLGVLGGVVFGGLQAKESYDQAKEGNYGKSTIAGLSSAASFAGLSKTAGKAAGPAGVALGALTDLESDLTLAKDFKDILGRKKRTYSVGPDGKTKEDVESIGIGDIIGTTIGAIVAAPVTAAILGYRTGNALGNALENEYRLGEKLGNFTSGVFSGGKSLVRLQESGKPIRGMKSKEAYDSDQILTRKMELVKEINKYNRAAGNPEISVGENILKAKKTQKRKDEADISALQEKLDKENKATIAGIKARATAAATAAGTTETGILNKKSTEEEEARRTKLRRSFLESFEKNGGADELQTTKEKVEYFLSLERQLNQGTDPNGFGTFKPTDFKDPEFAKSFDIYKRSKEKEAAREAKRVFSKPSEEFKNRPPQQSFPDDVLREAVRTGRSAETVMQDREDEKIKRGLIPPIPLPSQTGIRNRPDPFSKDVLLEAARRRVPAEKIIQEREAAKKDPLPLLPPALMGEIAIAGKSGSLIPGPLPSKTQGGEGFDPNKPDSYPADVVAEAIRTGRKPEQVIKDREQGAQATDVPGGYSKDIVEEAMNRRGLNLVPQAPLPPQPKPRDDSSDPFPRDVLLEATRRGVSAERVMQDRAGLGGGFMNADEANIRRGAMTQGMTLPEINQQEARETGLQNFPKDVLEEAMRRRVTAEQVMRERAGGAVPNFAAMSNSMMSSGDVYSRMRATSARSSMSGYSGGHVPNFAAGGDFTNAISEAMKNGITSAFPNGGSSSSVSNSNVINIDGRTSIQNASDDAMQGIIGILFDKFPELKKLGPSALNFKR